MTKVVVSGASGRLGTAIVGALRRDRPDWQVTALVRSVRAPGETDDPACIGEAALWVEAAPAPAVGAHLSVAAAARTPALVASTGLGRSDESGLRAHSERAPVLLAPNLSLGVAVLRLLVRQAARMLPDYDLEVLELHHRRKRDAPSGTAWSLAAAAAEARGQDVQRDAILARSGDVGPRGDTEIGLQSLRGGDIVGEHTLFVVGEEERLELTHRAQSRDLFGRGAVRAASFLLQAGRPPGWYTMDDVLEAP